MTTQTKKSKAPPATNALGVVMGASDVAEEWRLQAERDLLVAERLAQDSFFEWAAYAAQQAAEKAIKAVRYATAINTHVGDELSHNLSELATPLHELYGTLLPDEPDLWKLTFHEADGRYPSARRGSYQAPSRIYNQAMSDDALATARAIVQRCSNLTRELAAFWNARPVLGAAPGTTLRVSLIGMVPPPSQAAPPASPQALASSTPQGAPAQAAQAPTAATTVPRQPRSVSRTGKPSSTPAATGSAPKKKKSP